MIQFLLFTLSLGSITRIILNVLLLHVWSSQSTHAKPIDQYCYNNIIIACTTYTGTVVSHPAISYNGLQHFVVRLILTLVSRSGVVQSTCLANINDVVLIHVIQLLRIVTFLYFIALLIHHGLYCVVRLSVCLQSTVNWNQVIFNDVYSWCSYLSLRWWRCTPIKLNICIPRHSNNNLMYPVYGAPHTTTVANELTKAHQPSYNITTWQLTLHVTSVTTCCYALVGDVFIWH